MSRILVWLAALACLLVAAFAVGGWWAGLMAGLAGGVATLAAARLWLSDAPMPSPRPAQEPRPQPLAPPGRVMGALTWAGVSGRHFDRSTRPLLQRALRAAAVGRGLDVQRDQDTLRQLLGERAWHLLDPARPARDDSFTGGVSPAVLEHVVTRLEELAAWKT